MGTTGRTRLTSAGLPNPRTADVRDPPGQTVPAGFPSPYWRMLGASVDSVTAVCSAASFARPYDVEAFTNHRPSQCAPEWAALRPVRQGPPHDAHGGPGP